MLLSFFYPNFNENAIFLLYKCEACYVMIFKKNVKCNILLHNNIFIMRHISRITKKVSYPDLISIEKSSFSQIASLSYGKTNRFYTCMPVLIT